MPFVFFACRTLTRDISSLTYTRTCWPRLLSPRRQRKGKNSRSSPLLLSVTLSVFTHFRPFPSSVSACSPSWDASGTPAPPLLRLPPRRRTDRPRGPGKQVPTLQAAPMPDARAEKKKQCHCSITSLSLLITIVTTQGALLCFFIFLSTRTVCVYLATARILTLQRPLGASLLIPKAQAVNSRGGKRKMSF